MVALERTEVEVTRELTDGTAIAAVNGPRAVVVCRAWSNPSSRARPALGQAGRAHTGTGWVSHAFHSPLMDPMLADSAVS